MVDNKTGMRYNKLYVGRRPSQQEGDGFAGWLSYSESEIIAGCGAVGSARRLGRRCRRFESCHSDHQARAWSRFALQVFSLSLIHILNPENRTMLRVEMADAMKADEIFTILMGEKVAPRREFIETNAKYVQNLDI